DDHQNDNKDHQDRRYLIDNTVEFLAIGIPVNRKILHPARKSAMDSRQEEYQKEFPVNPRRSVPVTRPSEIEASEPGNDHRGIDDRFQEPSLHHLERLRLL